MEIILKDVSKSIAGVTILKNMNYTFTGGKIYGLRGKNGCGKTMLMRSIAGLMKPTSGDIYIDGDKLYSDLEVPKSVGILIENPVFLPEYSGFQNLKLLAGIKKRIDDNQIRTVIERVGLDCEDKRPVRKYSLGMKQRLGIAAAIMESPDIILLDEPINAIDEAGVEVVRKCIFDLKNDNRIILVACHDREELDSLADVVLKLSDGTIEGEEVKCARE